jgi:hypothetical protein
MTPPSNPQAIQTININYIINGSGVVLFTFGGISFKTNYNKPVLLLESQNNCPASSYDPDWNVYNFGKNASIRLILTNSVPQSHPMHLHGHTIWVLAEGNGEWDGTITNPNNPIRRDTIQMGPASSLGPSYTVIEWEANNPGVWPLHCHVAGHASTGLFLYVLVRIDLYSIARIPDVHFFPLVSSSNISSVLYHRIMCLLTVNRNVPILYLHYPCHGKSSKPALLGMHGVPKMWSTRLTPGNSFGANPAV